MQYAARYNTSRTYRLMCTRQQASPEHDMRVGFEPQEKLTVGGYTYSLLHGGYTYCGRFHGSFFLPSSPNIIGAARYQRKPASTMC